MEPQDQRPRITSQGVKTFVSALAVTLSDIKRIPEGDRNTDWIMNRLHRELFHAGSEDISHKDYCTLSVLEGTLNLYVCTWDWNYDRSP